jgi:hypothetical protein
MCSRSAAPLVRSSVRNHRSGPGLEYGRHNRDYFGFPKKPEKVAENGLGVVRRDEKDSGSPKVRAPSVPYWPDRSLHFHFRHPGGRIALHYEVSQYSHEGKGKGRS